MIDKTKMIKLGTLLKQFNDLKMKRTEIIEVITSLESDTELRLVKFRLTDFNSQIKEMESMIDGVKLI